jgi:hypothetical protein
VLTGYGIGWPALGLIKTRRALETKGGGLKTNSGASKITFSQSSLQHSGKNTNVSLHLYICYSNPRTEPASIKKTVADKTITILPNQS